MLIYNMKGKKYYFSVLILFVLFCISITGNQYTPNSRKKYYSEDFYGLSKFFNGKVLNYPFFGTHDFIVKQYFEQRQDLPTSNLGSILFKNNEKNISLQSANKTFVVLIWKYYDWLRNRHILNFGAKSQQTANPLGKCSVTNCVFSGKEELLNTADAVVVILQRGDVPHVSNRNTSQRWIFLDDESPRNLFSLSKRRLTAAQLSNVFNWSMTYRTISDIPVPYGRTVPLKSRIIEEELGPEHLQVLVPKWDKKQNDVLIAIMISNCTPYRMKLIKDLKKYINVDVYGKCSDDPKLRNSCPGHFHEDCEVLGKYLFYLVLENSMCDEYLTEKGFSHAYSKGAIPVILGPKQEDLKRLLPPESFLNIKEYFSIEYLAKDINRISNSNVSIAQYHRWRNDFEVFNEHGYFKSESYHYCRVCEALNVNDRRVKIYDEEKLKYFMDVSKNCNIKKK